jgi:hypothetical protein
MAGTVRYVAQPQARYLDRVIERDELNEIG